MKLASFTHEGRTRLGVVGESGVIDLAAAAPDLPVSMTGFLEAGADALAAARRARAPVLPLDAVQLEAPVMHPRKIFAIGLNYADHVAESGQQKPAHQIWFSKAPTAITGPHADVLKPAVSDFLDYEAELCFVIGRRARHVPRGRAGEVIAGYCCGNDVSVRDWQLRTGQFTIGKSFDTHAPIGPWLTTADELGDPHDLEIKCFVNGRERQSSNTRHLIFDCFAQVAELSQAMTLEPGDVIFTGTPGGVGGAMKPPQFLKPGDRVRVEIEKLGALENVIAAERAVTMIGAPGPGAGQE